jgi:DNA repair protein RecN (Recombination protein N)
MLIELRIRDLAVLQDLSLEMGPGLNALTGETGAGKSIIVGGLGLLLGERASGELVRSGAERAVVEAVFDLTGRPELIARLDELGLPAEEPLLILRREVQAEGGRNRAWVNGSPTTAGIVGELGRSLVEIHGQHEHQTLLHSAPQRTILDAYAGAETLAGEVAHLHAEVRELDEEIEHRRARRREIEARSDFLRFQFSEIEEAQIDLETDTEIGAEVERLVHAEELVRSAESVNALLYAEEGAVSDRLAEARDQLRKIVRIDDRLAPFLAEIEALYHQSVELGRSLSHYAGGVEFSPARAEALRSRADHLTRLRRKYGPELSDVLATRERLGAELEELDRSGFEVGELERRLTSLRGTFLERVATLTQIRLATATQLSPQVTKVLHELGMPGAHFEIEAEPLEAPEAGGGERIHFVATLNPGFDLRPLARIASGGELSRVMLALKSILAREDRVPTLVFDEIDAGIGGAVATAVARKVREVAEHHQVFVITHLAQLASRADRQLKVEKGEVEGVALATVRELSGEERVVEIARMLGGDAESATSRKHARELLATG